MGEKFYGLNREGNGVLQIVDRLEQLIEGASRVPLTGKIMLEGHAVLDLLDQVRSLLPAEIGEAQRVSRDREKMLAEAARRAQEIKEAATQEVERRLQENEIVKQANARAHEILKKAETVAQDIHSGAENYADELLGRLELTLERSLAGVKQGRQELKARKVKSA